MGNRIWALLITIYLILIIYGVRLFQLQAVEFRDYSTLSKDNYLKQFTELAPRGRIYDRNGVIIASNRLATDLYYDGKEVAFKERIESILGQKLPTDRDKPVYNISEEKATAIGELIAGESSIELRERVERVYPNPISGSILGYTRLPTREDVEKGYGLDELIGAFGLEAALEDKLRGKSGVVWAEVNNRQRKVRIDKSLEPEAGHDVQLTIDLYTQRAAEKAAIATITNSNRVKKQHGIPMDQKVKGAVVAVDPTNGEVIAMVTVPTFDPNIFGKRPRPAKQISDLFTDKKYSPTQNRAVLPYFPGSVYKLATSSMLLESGYVNPNTTFNCSTFIRFGGIRRNWSNRNMGPLNNQQAIAQSCNTWYYQAVMQDTQRIVEKLSNRAKELGLGRTTGLEISESSGFIPTIEWKKEVYDQPWWPGETLSIAIGQGSNLITPVQIARMLATISQDGRQPELHLVHKLGDTITPPKITQVPGTHWQNLKDGLRLTVTWGTSSTVLGNFPVKTGGKTGTAETASKKIGTEHAWYMGWGPVDGDPRYPPLVVVAMFEKAGGGDDVALPVVKQVMEAYWKVGEHAPKPKVAKP